MAEVEASVLRELYNTYELRGVGQGKDHIQLAALVGVSASTVEAVLRELKTARLVDYVEELNSVDEIHLRARGVRYVEESGRRTFGFAQHVVVSGGNVQMGSHNKQIIETTGRGTAICRT